MATGQTCLRQHEQIEKHFIERRACILKIKPLQKIDIATLNSQVYKGNQCNRTSHLMIVQHILDYKADFTHPRSHTVPEHTLISLSSVASNIVQFSLKANS